MKTFEMPNVEVVKFDVTDVITTSIEEPTDPVTPPVAGPIAPCM